ncbi:hypothetical protein D3C72_2225510 [compost metagenome]
MLQGQVQLIHRVQHDTDDHGGFDHDERQRDQQRERIVHTELDVEEPEHQSARDQAEELGGHQARIEGVDHENSP